MAACLITVGGTPGLGSARINYTLGSNAYSIYVWSGDPLYIDDTATDVTYELAEDATVSSLCLTVTEVIYTCYLFSYTVNLDCYPNIYGDNNAQFQFDQLILGSAYGFEKINISPISTSGMTLLNTLGSLTDRVTVGESNITTSGTGSTYTNSFILRVSTADVPELRMNNILDNSKSYLKGILSGTCVIPS